MITKFEDLRAALEGDVLLPGDAGFDESLDRWSATMKKPAVCMSPSSHLLLPFHLTPSYRQL